MQNKNLVHETRRQEYNVVSTGNTLKVVSQGSEGLGLAFYDTKVLIHLWICIPAVIKETSFLKAASCSNSQSNC